jgi:hypothetical protein
MLLAAGKIIFNGHPKNTVEEICSQWLVICLIGFFRFQKVNSDIKIYRQSIENAINY